MKTNRVFAVVMAVFVLAAFASPALAASSDRPVSIGVCTYGYVQSLDPKTQVITVRCRTWAEWQALQAHQGIGNAIKSARGAYERKVTLPMSKRGDQGRCARGDQPDRAEYLVAASPRQTLMGKFEFFTTLFIIVATVLLIGAVCSVIPSDNANQ